VVVDLERDRGVGGGTGRVRKRVASAKRAVGAFGASRAAKLSVEITEDVANDMDWDLPPGIFCFRYINKLEPVFKSTYPDLGATAAKK
jgi:hypothetical protein